MTKLPGVGALAVAVSILLLAGCSVAGDFGDGSSVGAKAYDPALRSMKIGVCLNTAHSRSGPVLGEATVVKCTARHSYEVFAHHTSAEASTYPEETLPQESSDFCSAKFRAYTGAGVGGSLLFAPFAVFPSAKDWEAGHRVTTCLIVPPVDSSASTTFTTSARHHQAKKG